MKPLIVGENNPYSDDPAYALWPDPPRSAGGRLCHAILGMRVVDYVSGFDRVNLLSEAKWSSKKARAATYPILDDTRHSDFILLGSKVAKAFGVPFEPFKIVDLRQFYTRHRFLVLPHPSGRCRVWNDRLSVIKARASVAEFWPAVSDKLGKTDA